MYSFDECDLQASTQSSLKQHQQSKHEGVKYSCEECEFKTGYKIELKRHQESRHEGVL